MGSLRWETGASPTIILGFVRGDLRVGASPGPYVEAHGAEREGLEVVEVSGGLRIESPTECKLLVPPQAALEVRAVGGSAVIEEIRGELLLRTIGGDLRLTRVGQTAVETVGGALAAYQVDGSLMADHVGGDARVEGVSAALNLRSIGGDLRLSHAGGVAQVTAGGDAQVSLQPPPGSQSVIQAGGDLRCALPEQASVRVRIFAGGDMRVAVPTECEEAAEGCLVRLGREEAELELRAGGDLSLRSGEGKWVQPEVDFGEAVAASVGAELGAQMADLELKLDGLGDELGFDTGRIGRRLRQAVERAQRKAERARKLAEAVRGFSPQAPAVDDQPSEEERMIILQMVEQGKLSVDQADSLLQALED